MPGWIAGGLARVLSVSPVLRALARERRAFARGGVDALFDSVLMIVARGPLAFTTP